MQRFVSASKDRLFEVVGLVPISLRNLRVHLLSTILTAISVAAGVALLTVIWSMIDQTRGRYRQSTAGYSAVVGPKQGAPLSLVLNTVFNLGYPEGPIPFRLYKELREPRNRQRFTLRAVVPQARGDHVEGFAIVGTTDAMFTEFKPRRGNDGRREVLAFAEGKRWEFGHEELLEFAERRAQAVAEQRASSALGPSPRFPVEERFKKAVLGYTVARSLGKSLGDTIVPVHGEKNDPLADTHDEATCEVVGVLARTGSPIDRAIFLPLSVFLSLDGHETIRANQDAVADNLGLTAIVLDCASAIKPQHLRREFDTRPDAQVALPILQVGELLKLIGDVTTLLEIVAKIVLLVAAISILVALYNTMNERRREIAIMRSLGARRVQILAIVVIEAALIPILGAAVGVVAGHGALYFGEEMIADRSGIPIEWGRFSAHELWLILGAGVLGGFAGILPAIRGSLTPVASNLGPVS